MPGRAVTVESLKQRPVALRHSRVDGIVRVGEGQHHPVMLAEELSLPDPYAGIRVLEDREESVVLREGDREFHHARVEVRKVAAATSGLRLVRIGVAVGRVVIEPESGHQLPSPLGGRGAEPDGLPAVRVLPHCRKPLCQQPPGAEVATIMPETVHPDLAPLFPQLADHVRRDLVPQRDEIPRRPVAEQAFWST